MRQYGMIKKKNGYMAVLYLPCDSINMLIIANNNTITNDTTPIPLKFKFFRQDNAKPTVPNKNIKAKNKYSARNNGTSHGTQ